MQIVQQMKRNRENRIEQLSEQTFDAIFKDVELALKKHISDERFDNIQNQLIEIISSISEGVATNQADDEIGEAELEIGLQQYENRYI